MALAQAGFLTVLDETSAATIPDGSEELFGFEGQIYGQPMDLTVTGVVFNRTAAEAASMREYPEDFAALLRACTALASEGHAMFAVAGAAPPNTGMMAMSVSASLVYAAQPDWNERRTRGETTFAGTEGWRETLETIVQMHEADCFQGGAEGAGFDAITSGLSTGTAMGAFVPSATALEIAAAAPGAELDVRAFPAADGRERFILASANYALSITEQSENKAAAQDFLNWAAEPSQARLYAQSSGALPVGGVGDERLDDTIYEPVADLLTGESFAPLPNNMWPNAGVYDALGSGVQGLLTGQQTVDQVLRAMDEAWGE